MDVASTSFSLLKTITTSLVEKLGQAEKLEKRELKFAGQYKKLVGVLAEEADNIKCQLDEIIEHSNSVATSRLLSGGGYRGDLNALDELTKSLNSTNNFLKKQDGAVSEMLAKLSNKQTENVSKMVFYALTDNH